MFNQRCERKEFCCNDFNQSLERNRHLNSLSANIMLFFSSVEAFQVIICNCCLSWFSTIINIGSIISCKETTNFRLSMGVTNDL